MTVNRTDDDGQEEAIIKTAVAGAYKEVPVLRLTLMVKLIIVVFTALLLTNSVASAYNYNNLSRVQACQEISSNAQRVIAQQDRKVVDNLFNEVSHILKLGRAAPPNSLSIAIDNYNAERAQNDKQRNTLSSESACK